MAIADTVEMIQTTTDSEVDAVIAGKYPDLIGMEGYFTGLPITTTIPPVPLGVSKDPQRAASYIGKAVSQHNQAFADKSLKAIGGGALNEIVFNGGPTVEVLLSLCDSLVAEGLDGIFSILTTAAADLAKAAASYNRYFQQTPDAAAGGFDVHEAIKNDGRKQRAMDIVTQKLSDLHTVIHATVGVAEAHYTVARAESETEARKVEADRIRLGVSRWLDSARKEAAKVHTRKAPPQNPEFIPPKGAYKLFTGLMHQMSEGGKASHVLLTGHTGIGKTSLAVEFAAFVGLPLFIVEAYEHKYASAFYGRVRLKDGQTEWVDSTFAEAVTRGNCVICIDELSRAEPTAVNAFFPLLDWRRCAQIDEAEKEYAVGPNTFFMATANIGNAYTGTNRLDDALVNRFDLRINSEIPDANTLESIINMATIDRPKAKAPNADLTKELKNYTPPGTNKRINNALAKAIEQINAKVATGELQRLVSPREAKAAAEWIAIAGGETLKNTIVSKYPSTAMGDHRLVVDTILKPVYEECKK